MEMKTADFNGNGESPHEAPKKLVAALKALPQEKPFVPGTIDEAVLRAARNHLEPAKTQQDRWLKFAPWLAGAAGVGATALVLVLSQPAELARKSAGDVNHDGRIDILDAYALSLRLRSGEVRDRAADANGDGKIDNFDVAALAARVVELGKGRSS